MVYRHARLGQLHSNTTTHFTASVLRIGMHARRSCVCHRQHGDDCPQLSWLQSVEAGRLLPEAALMAAGTATDRMRELFTAKSFSLNLGRTNQQGGQGQSQQRR